MRDDKIISFTTVRNWCFAIDSSYALRRLSSKAPLDVYLLSMPRATVTFHVQSPSAQGTAAAKGCYEKTICLANMSVECVGGDNRQAKDYLRDRKIDLSQPSHWYPDYPRFPAIDGVLLVPSTKEGHYAQYTVGASKELKIAQLIQVHGLVKQSLEAALQAAGGNISEWSFSFHAIAPSQKEAKSPHTQASEDCRSWESWRDVHRKGVRGALY